MQESELFFWIWVRQQTRPRKKLTVSACTHIHMHVRTCPVPLVCPSLTPQHPPCDSRPLVRLGSLQRTAMRAWHAAGPAHLCQPHVFTVLLCVRHLDLDQCLGQLFVLRVLHLDLHTCEARTALQQGCAARLTQDG